jgi:uncharacterized glyoxalase superfamily protein PhnB
MLTNRSMPTSTVIPVLVYEDVPDAVEWLCDTFGFVAGVRLADHRAYLSIGEGSVIVTERRIRPAARYSDAVVLRPPHRGEVSHALIVRVEDVDAHYEHAHASGARIVRPLSDHRYGERQYTAEDLAGHRWTFSQSIADVAPEEWGGESPTATNDTPPAAG